MNILHFIKTKSTFLPALALSLLMVTSQAVLAMEGEEEIDTGTYHNSKLNSDFSHAKAKVIDGGKTLSINAYDNKWFVSEGPDEGKIIQPIRDVLARKDLTKVILDERYTGAKTYEEFSQLIAANPSIKVLEAPTYIGPQERMKQQIMPMMLNLFARNHGLTIVAGENKPSTGCVQLTFIVP